MTNAITTINGKVVAPTILGQGALCQRRLNSDQVYRLNFDQGR
jgi:hypothetical protein